MRDTTKYIKNTENPFSCMSSEAKYWIGYILADGHIVNNGRHYSISLFSKNEDILMKFKDFIGEKAKMYKRPTGIIQVVYHSKPTTQWFSETFNIPENKSLILNPTLEIDWDILHGYFDGDGCIRMTKSKGRWNRYEAKFTTGSEIWAERIKDFLEKEGISSYIKQKKNAYDVTILGKANIFYLYNKLYQSGTSKLEYKYNTFVSLFSDEQLKMG